MPREQRFEIKNFLLDDPELFEDDSDIDGETAAELNRRIAAIERGEVRGVPARQFLAELEAEFP